MPREGEGNAVYKLRETKESQTRKHETVAKVDKGRLDRDWRQEVKTAYYYIEFKEECMKMLSDFDWMWDGRSDQINIAKILIKISLSDEKPMQSAAYRADLKARESEKTEIGKMLSEEAIELARTQRAALVVCGVCTQE